MCNHAIPPPPRTRPDPAAAEARRGAAEARRQAVLQVLERAARSRERRRREGKRTSSSAPPYRAPVPVAAPVKKKACWCSPTTHPGSFRCRQHIKDYVFPRRPRACKRGEW